MHPYIQTFNARQYQIGGVSDLHFGSQVQPSPKLPLPLCGVNSTLFVQSQLCQQPRPIAVR
jgi:hypothetical protein